MNTLQETCFYVPGILVPLVIILVLVAALVLSMPLMVGLLFYNLFGNCRLVDGRITGLVFWISSSISKLFVEIVVFVIFF